MSTTDIKILTISEVMDNTKLGSTKLELGRKEDIYDDHLPMDIHANS